MNFTWSEMFKDISKNGYVVMLGVGSQPFLNELAVDPVIEVLLNQPADGIRGAPRQP